MAHDLVSTVWQPAQNLFELLTGFGLNPRHAEEQAHQFIPAEQAQLFLEAPIGEGID